MPAELDSIKIWLFQTHNFAHILDNGHAENTEHLWIHVKNPLGNTIDFELRN